jgi:hypothetical protein
MNLEIPQSYCEKCSKFRSAIAESGEIGFSAGVASSGNISNQFLLIEARALLCPLFRV